MKDYEKTYEKHWKDIVENHDGTLNLEQIKRELSDYSFLLEEVPKAYCGVTCNKISKPNTPAFEVITANSDVISDIVTDEVDDIIQTLGFKRKCKFCGKDVEHYENFTIVEHTLCHASCCDHEWEKKGLWKDR